MDSMIGSVWNRISELKEPFNDAVNYKSRAEKDWFNQIFLRTDHLKKCLAPATYYLMGEKGTGKTAYAVYLENNNVDDFRCHLSTMAETQYRRFVSLKDEGEAKPSDYTAIWRAILLVLVARFVVAKSKTTLDTVTRRFSKVEAALKTSGTTLSDAEIESAFEVVCSTGVEGDFGSSGARAAGKKHKSTKESFKRVKDHVAETERSLRDAISDLTLDNGHILFFDGIDFRPETISYTEYIQCIKGLGEAIWQLNNEFFNSIRDSKGRIKIVLLIRPDVFHSLNLYNSNSKLQDNTVFLDWATTEEEYRDSRLFNLSGRYFAAQQSVKPEARTAWDHYCESESGDGRTFKRLIKQTFQKPR